MDPAADVQSRGTARARLDELTARLGAPGLSNRDRNALRRDVRQLQRIVRAEERAARRDARDERRHEAKLAKIEARRQVSETRAERLHENLTAARERVSRQADALNARRDYGLDLGLEHGQQLAALQDLGGDLITGGDLAGTGFLGLDAPEGSRLPLAVMVGGGVLALVLVVLAVKRPGKRKPPSPKLN